MKRICILICSLLLCLSVCVTIVAADESIKAYHCEINEDGISIYVESVDSYESVICQIGQDYAEVTDVKSGNEVAEETYILIDNSLSIREKYRDTLKAVAKNIVAAAGENEKFTVATFDTAIHFIAESSMDHNAIIQGIDQIEFQNLDTNVIDIMYSLYDYMEKNSDSFKKVILMTDGVNTIPTAFTREELLNRIKDEAYPVYTLGCTFESNADELQNLFRISRETQAAYYFLDQAGSPEEIAGEILSLEVAKVNVDIPEFAKDGSVKGIRLIFETENGEMTATVTASMPFVNYHNAQNDAEVEDDETQSGDAILETDTEAVNSNGSEANTETIIDKVFANKWIIIAAAAGIVIIVLIIILIIVSSKKNRKSTTSKAPNRKEPEKTEFLGDEKTELLGASFTEIMGLVNVRIYDLNNPGNIKEYPLESSLTIGRTPGKAQISFEYEKSISGQHCQIYKIGERVFIKDLGSANGTYVDGILLDRDRELKNGSIIRIGRLQLKFQIV